MFLSRKIFLAGDQRLNHFARKLKCGTLCGSAVVNLIVVCSIHSWLKLEISFIMQSDVPRGVLNYREPKVSLKLL